ncbi:MAG: alkaline phosphatase [Cyclobacteriaceae bacterium]|nr:alkaline phosphatase [Cyclobacteriaceae bacterium]
MKKFLHTTVSLFLIIPFVFISCKKKTSTEEAITREVPRPVNVILLIGDGMGLAQVSTTVYFKKDGPSNFQRFEYIGLINSSSADAKITDSAASGTAFACGELTYNGAIGVDTAKQSITNIIEYVSRSGYQTGVVATSSITHATPASFYAHAASRNMNELIATQLTESEVDVFMGGGRKFFENREDGEDMIQRLKDRNFNIYYSLEELPAMDSGKKYGILAAPDGLPPVYQGRGEFLSQATEKTLNYLSGKQQPFFLMVEGSQIDWAGHENNGEYLITEMLDFDRTIGKVMDFAEKNPGTLVIVTADHETGGLALSANSGSGMGANYDEIMPTFSTGGHTSTLLPVFASGPGAEKFAGIYQNNQIYHKIVDLLSLE